MTRSGKRSIGAYALAMALLCAPARGQVPEALSGRAVTAIQIEGETSGATSARDVGIPIGASLDRRLVGAAPSCGCSRAGAGPTCRSTPPRATRGWSSTSA